MTYLGRPTRQIDWQQRTSGATRFTADTVFPDLLVGRILRSPHPHAVIDAIDTRAAAALPGVAAIITIGDFPPGARYIHEGAGDRPPMADGVVRYVGEEVAAVAAETAEQAQAALDAIVVSYRPQRAPLDVASARNKRSARLHKRAFEKPNVSKVFRRRWGDPQAGKEAAPVSVSGEFHFGRQTHASMEPNSVVADWHSDTGKLHLWLSTQAPRLIRDEVAAIFRLSPDQVVCHEVAVGGGFGSKSRISEHEVIAGALAMKAKRPVRLVLSRSEEFEATKSRHPFDMSMTLHADAAGHIRVIEGDVSVENGAYDHVGLSVTGAGLKGLGLIYRPVGIRLDAELIDTAILPGGAFRGYGTTQVTFALESLIDELAEKLDRDALDLRIQNANLDGERTLIGARPHSVRLQECLRAAGDAIGWERLRRDPVPGQGIGIASGVHLSGSYAETDANRSDAAIDIDATGHVRVRFGGADCGTGQRTLLAQIAADELDVAIEDVDVVMMDTERTPFDLGAWSSRGTHFSGHAVRKAAQAMADKLKAIASNLGRQAIGELVAFSNETVNGVLTVETSYVDNHVVRPDPKTGLGNISASYNYAAHAAHVAVDALTGEVRLLGYVAAHDAGTPLNPTALHGQIVGGAAMGIGAALGEEMIFEQGKLANTGYLHYALPRAADLPNIRSILVDCHDAAGPYGAKAVGEIGINPPPPAIANAIYNAIGIRLREPPFTPDKILTALAAKTGRQRHFHLWRRPDRWWIALVRWAYPRGLLALLHRGREHRPSRCVPPALQKLETPETIGQALRSISPGAAPLGGGTDLLALRSQGLTQVGRLVSLSDIPELKVIRRTPDSLTIGSAVTLAALTDAALGHPLLAEAARTIATPQIRNAATLAGNLVQTKRCWFFRNGFECFKRIGPTAPCYAIEGDHRFYHAAISGHRCQAVTPSDMATVLAALDATLLVATQYGERRVSIHDFYSGPGETILQANEMVLSVDLDRAALGRRGVFEKLRLWEGDFAVVSVAITAHVDARGHCHDLRIVCGGIAPTPWRATRTERALDGTALTAKTLRARLDKELNARAHPLRRNGWKLDALAGLCERAVQRLAT